MRYRIWRTGAVSASVLALVLSTCAGSASAGRMSSPHSRSSTAATIGWFQSPVMAAVIQTQPRLEKMVPAKLNWLPIQSGVAALSALKGGSFDFLDAIGNPPVVTALVKHIDITILWATHVDAAGLIVQKSIKRPADLAGKTLATVTNSSEDFSFHGWLQQHGLLTKVQLVGMAPDQMVAAFKRGSIAGAYIWVPASTQMMDAGGHQLVTSAQMNSRGYPSMNVDLVSTSFAKSHPDVVRGFVCALAGAAKMINSGQRDAVASKMASIAGLSKKESIKETRVTTFASPGDELTAKWLGSPSKLAAGNLAQSLLKGGQYLQKNGSIPSVPSMSDIVKHIDPSYARKAISGKCSSK